MKTTIQLITLITTLVGMASLRAAESWEGSDDFTSSANSAILWRKVVDHPVQGRALFEGGQVGYRANRKAENAAWAWGRRGYQIPSSASWEMECTVRLPTNPPLGVNSTKAGMFVASPDVPQRNYRAVSFKVYQLYDSNSGVATNFPQPIPETDYGRGRELSRSNDLPLTNYYSTLALVFRHNALNQTDDYEVYEVQGGTNRSLLTSQSYRSGLAASPHVLVGFVLAGKPFWSGSSLGLDNWSIEAFNPDAINLPALTKAGTTISGSAWTLTIQNLRLVKATRGGGFSAQATGSLAFGSTTLSIPVTGSIQSDGTFLLTGTGSGSAKGYGFSLRYDTFSGVAITGKSTVTAPRQKAIRF